MKTINIIGSGSLGSFTALLLSKMAPAFGWKLKYYDFDSVEEKNRRNQFFRKSDIGRKKTLALKEILDLFSDYQSEAIPKKITSASELQGIVVVLVDSIRERIEILKSISYCAYIPLLIDARSGGDVAIIYALDPRDQDQVAKYQKTLETEGAAPAPCANESQLPIIFQIAALIGQLLSLFESKKLRKFIDIPINYEDWPSFSISAIMARVKSLFEK